MNGDRSDRERRVLMKRVYQQEAGGSETEMERERKTARDSRVTLKKKDSSSCTVNYLLSVPVFITTDNVKVTNQFTTEERNIVLVSSLMVLDTTRRKGETEEGQRE